VNALLALLFALQQAAPAAAPAPQRPDVGGDTVPPPVGAVVQLEGDSLFTLYFGTTTYSSADRAKRVGRALEKVANAGLGAGDTVGTIAESGRTEITLGGQPLLFIYDADAAPTGVGRPALAARYASTVRAALAAAAEDRTAGALWRDALRALLATAVLAVVLLVLHVGFGKLATVLEGSRTRLSVAMRRIGLEGTSEDASTIVESIARYTHVALILLALAVYIPIVLRIFPQTAGIASPLIAAVRSPIGTALRAIVGYVPNLILIAIIAIGTRIVLRLVQAFFLAVERGSVRLRRFDPEWAIPTFEIVRPLILALAFVLIFPYLPGANSEAIKGVTIFLGVLLSFGSSSAIANLIAGVVLLYSRAFRIGDWVRVGASEGKVITRTLLMTRLRTVKNVEISVPSSVMINTAIENFTEKARSGTLILHTTVTIGYDAPWRTVHELLLAAARDTILVLKDPAPFVLQTALNDFNVSYQINAYTDAPDRQPDIYGDLHRNIQEKFNAAGVEIMSPNYHAIRDGNTVTIPAKQRPADYRAPSFRVETDPK
jgi:small-conductance mechanosensitive channel